MRNPKNLRLPWRSPSSSPFPFNPPPPLHFPSFLRLQLPLWRLYLPYWRLYPSTLAIYHVSTVPLSHPPLQIIRSLPPLVVPSITYTSFFKFLDLVFSKSNLFTLGSPTPWRAIPPYSQTSPLLAATKSSPFKHQVTASRSHSMVCVPHAPTFRELSFVHDTSPPPINHLPPLLLVSDWRFLALGVHCRFMVFTRWQVAYTRQWFATVSTLPSSTPPSTDTAVICIFWCFFYCLSIPLFIHFYYSCYSIVVRVGSKGILSVMILFTPNSLRVWTWLKNLETVILFVPCLAAKTYGLCANNV